MSMRRVVITGLGAVSPLGLGASHNWQRLLRAESGLSKITSPAFKNIPCRVAGFVPVGKGAHEFNREVEYTRQRAKEVSLATAYALKAAGEALKQAQWLPTEKAVQCRSGVCIGNTMCEPDYTVDNKEIMDRDGFTKIAPFAAYRDLLNIPAGTVSIEFGLRGPNMAAIAASASGLHSIGLGYRLVRDGDADVMVCGGSETPVYPLIVAGVARIHALSTKHNDEPSKALRPLSADRDGMCMGEGAAVMVLEEYQHAKKRGAKIFGEVLGYGLSSDAHHWTQPQPDGEGGYQCMLSAARHARVKPSDVGLVTFHATGTQAGDRAEAVAVKRFCGDAIQNTWMCATKAATGHLVAASGAIEAMFAVLSAHEGVIPPMPNLTSPDRVFLDGPMARFPTGREPREWASKRRVVMKNAFGFTGTNATVVFSNFIE